LVDPGIGGGHGDLPAGSDTIKFGNTTAYAPDLDAVTIN
jgi:hypothetical protein